ncbi:hypothetical protein [Microbacterium sp.]|uniref:hypothetical protein n=1 Tax=Microbacterium sp. TaxID=51671 RepID=UPI003A838865
MLSNSERSSAARSGSRMMHGGYASAKPLTRRQSDTFNALVDTFIPAEDGWPPAAQLSLAPLAAQYLVPDDGELSLYPNFRVSEFFEILDRRLPGLADLTNDQRVPLMSAFEDDDVATFRRVLDFVYYVYYGHSDVVELVRQHTRYGKDFHGRPQPIGYDAVLENWGTRRPSADRGTFIPTNAVLRAPQARKAGA